MQAWSPALAATAWQRLDVRDGATGPLVGAIVTRRVVSRHPRRQHGDEAVVAVRRSRDRAQDKGVHVDAALSPADPETPLGELARVATAEQRREACRQRSQSDAGLADEAGRHWTGGPQQHTRSFLATWCLVRETERGKKMAPRDHRPADASGYCPARARGVAVWDDGA